MNTIRGVRSTVERALRLGNIREAERAVRSIQHDQASLEDQIELLTLQAQIEQTRAQACANRSDKVAELEARGRAIECLRAAHEACRTQFTGDRETIPHDIAEWIWEGSDGRDLLRTRISLAAELWQVGRVAEAVWLLSDCIRLRTPDGRARYFLTKILVEEHADDAALEVMARFPNYVDPPWDYLRALIIFRKYGDCERSRGALRFALERDPEAARYLRKGSGPEDVEPDRAGYLPGAYIVLQLNASLWRETPGATEWIRSVRRLPHR